MSHFGPYEDALSTASLSLFHTRISPYLNNGRLLAKTVVDDVARMDLPLSSQEGFLRQVIGWREFVHHVHDATDGFRSIEASGAPNVLSATTPLPAAYWQGGPYNPSGVKSGLHCLDHEVESLWQTA